MRLVKPSYKIIEQEPGIQGIYKQIELAARNCYKSDPVEGITSKDFVDRMIKRGHLSTLEHGTVYLKVPMYYANCIDSPCEGLDVVLHSPHSKVKYEPAPELDGLIDWTGREISNDCYYITTNYRVIVENKLEHLLEFLCEPTEFHEKRVTVKFTSNIHFYKDLTRHRRMSFAIESTRYCNYNKNKFNNELTFIIPVWTDLREGSYPITWNRLIGEDIEGITEDKTSYRFFWSLAVAERDYIKLINDGWQAQQAAEVLPQATKADIIVTGFVSDWQHIFNLRTSIIAATGKPHPEVSRLMDPLYKEFKTKNLL